MFLEFSISLKNLSGQVDFLKFIYTKCFLKRHKDFYKKSVSYIFIYYQLPLCLSSCNLHYSLNVICMVPSLHSIINPFKTSSAISQVQLYFWRILINIVQIFVQINSFGSFPFFFSKLKNILFLGP